MTILLQVLIAATGNYAFFNMLTPPFAVLLLDDGASGALAKGCRGVSRTKPMAALISSRWRRPARRRRRSCFACRLARRDPARSPSPRHRPLRSATQLRSLR
jgi:hypothetical protein